MSSAQSAPPGSESVPPYGRDSSKKPGGSDHPRFLMITTFYPPFHFGGDAIGIQWLCHALVRRGHHVTVVHDVDAFRMLHKGAPPAPLEHPEGLEAIGLESPLGRISSLLTQQTGRPIVHGGRIRRIAESGGFDVINYHNISLAGGPGLLSLGRAIKLYMAHEHWLVCPSHVLWRHGRELCTGRQCTRCVLHYRRPPQYWRYTGYLERQLDHVDAFIAMSDFSHRKHREFGFPREMEVLPYCLPDADPRPADGTGDSPHPRPYFLFVGRLEKIKGLDDVIPRFAANEKADLLIAGDGEYESALREKAAGSPRIRFLGRVEPDLLRRYYDHAIALVVPSVCYETFGIILIEAFRQGTPVVARRLGPLPEIVNRAGAGELFSDQEELTRAIDRFTLEPDLRRRYSEAGRKAFREYWSESAVVPLYIDIVRRAAERRGDQQLVQRLAHMEVT